MYGNELFMSKEVTVELLEFRARFRAAVREQMNSCILIIKVGSLFGVRRWRRWLIWRTWRSPKEFSTHSASAACWSEGPRARKGETETRGRPGLRTDPDLTVGRGRRTQLDPPDVGGLIQTSHV